MVARLQGLHRGVPAEGPRKAPLCRRAAQGTPLPRAAPFASGADARPPQLPFLAKAGKPAVLAALVDECQAQIDEYRANEMKQAEEDQQAEKAGPVRAAAAGARGEGCAALTLCTARPTGPRPGHDGGAGQWPRLGHHGARRGRAAGHGHTAGLAWRSVSRGWHHALCAVRWARPPFNEWADCAQTGGVRRGHHGAQAGCRRRREHGGRLKRHDGPQAGRCYRAPAVLLARPGPGPLLLPDQPGTGCILSPVGTRYVCAQPLDVNGRSTLLELKQALIQLNKAYEEESGERTRPRSAARNPPRP